MSQDIIKRTPLEALHEVFTNELRDGLENGMRAVDKDGNEVRQPANPAYLNVIRQFLKDNNIQATATNGNSLEKILLALQRDHEEQDSDRYLPMAMHISDNQVYLERE